MLRKTCNGDGNIVYIVTKPNIRNIMIVTPVNTTVIMTIKNIR
jgi:hypothetical protein